MNNISKKTVFLVSHSGKANAGGELSLLALAKELNNRDIDVRVIVPEQGEMLNLLAQADIKSIEVPFTWWTLGGARTLLDVWSNFQAIRRLKGIFSASESPVVISNTMTHPWAAIAAKSVGATHMWFIREYKTKDYGLHFVLGEKNTYRTIGRLSDHIFVNSAQVADDLNLRIKTPPSVSVSHPIVYDHNYRANVELDKSKPLRILNIGSVTSHKGQLEIVQALAKPVLKKSRLTFVGPVEKVYENKIRDFMERNHISKNRVKFEGSKSNPYVYFEHADVFVMSSAEETFGRVTVEALAAGMAVIGTGSGGTLQIIENGKTGYHYEPGNINQLAGFLDKLNHNRDKLNKLGSRGRKRYLKMYSPEKSIEPVLKSVQSCKTNTRRLNTAPLIFSVISVQLVLSASLMLRRFIGKLFRLPKRVLLAIARRVRKVLAG